MTKKRVDIRFIFDEEPEDDGYTHHELLSIAVLNSELTDEQLDTVAEVWAQSDRFSIDIVSGLIEVFGGDIYKH